MEFEQSAKPNPCSRANIVSKFLFLWLLPFLRKGARVTVRDVFEVLDEFEAGFLTQQLNREWDQRRAESGKVRFVGPLESCLLVIHGRLLLFLAAVSIFSECILKVLQPVLLRLLITSFIDSEVPLSHRYGYAVGLSMSILIYSAIFHTIGHQYTSIALKCRVALSGLIHRKTLRLSQSALGGGHGQVANLLSADVSRFELIMFLPFLVAGPSQLAIYAYLLWAEVGVYTMATAIGIVVLILPAQFWLFGYSSRIRAEASKRTDSRTRFMSQVIGAIRVVKLYAWETPFSALIHQLRKLEVRYLRKNAYLQALNLILFRGLAKMMILLTLTTHILTGHGLDVSSTFFCVAVINSMLYANLYAVPVASAQLAAIRVSMSRIQAFLLLDEQSTEHESDSTELRCSDIPSILMTHVSARWANDEPMTLRDVNLNVQGSQLVVIIGSIGAGKSSLLSCLIREMPVVAGQLTLRSERVSYMSQDPWIFPASLKDNILFGESFEAEKYKSVLRVCCLEDDIRGLLHGDETFVGERGVLLSGGQKARVSLARAMYQNSDVYLLDDPLSAVDIHVANKLFSDCIQSYLRNKLRVLVTHHLEYLPAADYILALDQGRVVAEGSYESILKQNIDISKFIARDEPSDHSSSLVSDLPSHVQDPAQTPSEDKVSENAVKASKDDSGNESEEGAGMGGHGVSCTTYLSYFRSSGSVLLTVIVFLGFILTQVVLTSSDWWLAHWIRGQDEQSGIPYLAVFASLVCGATLLAVGTTMALYIYCTRISVNLHNRLVSSIVHAPTSFFDKISSGQLMNLFTKEMGTVDERLPEAIYDTARISFEVLGVVVIVCLSNYFILIPTLIVLVVFVCTRQVYLGSARPLKRLELASRGPLLTCVVSTIYGLATIRSSHSQKLCHTQFEALQNWNTRTSHLLISSTRWFTIWLEMESAIYVTTIVLAFFHLPADALHVENIGLAISSAMLLNLSLQWGMRQTTEVENHMVSVENIVQHSCISPEGAGNITVAGGPRWTPSPGSIEFDSVCMRYGNDEQTLALRNVSFSVNPGEKVAIVGRTGAGKSSIVSALFRLHELSEGAVYIDGTCTKDVPLEELREGLSIIPQEPVLFPGTLRYNLDPFGKFCDSDLWAALQQANLTEIPSLDFVLSDGGSNLSTGERQLVCLARAILRRNQILIMDEATANVDLRTEALIREATRRNFASCTVLTIAHRLDTVIDSDRILVLHNGSVLEYDHPHVLLQNPDSHLTSMVNQIGSQQQRCQMYDTAARRFSTMMNMDMGTRQLQIEESGRNTRL